MEWLKLIISVALSLSVPITIYFGLKNRENSNQKNETESRNMGIGWQFIRFIVLSISIPTMAILALNDSLNGAAASIIAGAMGYAFGNRGETKAKSTGNGNE